MQSEKKYNVPKDTPYYLTTNDYRPAFKISRRKVLDDTNLDYYQKLLKKTNLDDTYFYNDSLKRIMKTSVHIKR